jgi:hypothetical protein
LQVVGQASPRLLPGIAEILAELLQIVLALTRECLHPDSEERQDKEPSARHARLIRVHLFCDPDPRLVSS